MQPQESILSSCTSGGCGAKIGPEDLRMILQGLPTNTPSPNLLVGFDSSDDAAIYRMNDDTALIATLDFFSPMVDDPRLFGRIAAANALSDVYAMGGRPLIALNIVCFPESLSKEILSEILAGGSEKVAEAGATIAGGHSIYDKEPKYGLSVNGSVQTSKIIRNNTPKCGDKLIITKPIGVGIVMMAHRKGVASPIAFDQAITSMQQLNRYAAEKMERYPVNACTDVTGFGLLAHLLEMCSPTYSATIDIGSLPLITDAVIYADAGFITSAGKRNRLHVASHGSIDHLSNAMQELLLDPQTSGGLLISVEKDSALSLLQEIQVDDPHARIIGEITEKRSHSIIFT
ncbi:selenide, water dikinase SelD (plasmid) [Entomospira entomophila]|uniref:Selenide, water dikinase n=1 Tax=Entomospira entomophila TaxID=2719988 RepID=A0A968GBH2_9SPIO|nr:selenide, water dikinase SelD [Entomospira entomophilus]NIZ41320.1 selenide, water dikinase SelD [Entomospira entomophilus]WDI36268.1 selenide, water dikinase SelD [Entomospira entomophilus]